MSKVKVRRIVAETGEIIEELVSQNRFKPPSPSRVLPPGSRAQILSGGQPALVWTDECPLEPGQEVTLSSKVSIEVWRVRKTKAGEQMIEPRDYVVKDMRGRMPRSTLPSKVTEAEETEPTKEVIEKARQEGAYTSSRSRAVPGTEDEVPEEYQRGLAQEAARKNVILRAERTGKGKLAQEFTARVEKRMCPSDAQPYNCT